jgi:hypothetical protein
MMLGLHEVINEMYLSKVTQGEKRYFLAIGADKI